MTLLSLVREAAGRIGGIARPLIVVGASDDTALQFLDLAQETVRQLVRANAWQGIRIPYTFTSVASVSQPGVPPDDFDRIVTDTEWNVSANRQIAPARPQIWAQLVPQSRGLGSGQIYRIVGGAFQIYPAPGVGEQISFEYVSRNAIKGVDGVTKASFTADTDTVLVPEELVILGLRWRWQQAKGFEYGESQETFERELELAISADMGPRTIFTSRPMFAGHNNMLSGTIAGGGVGPQPGDKITVSVDGGTF